MADKDEGPDPSIHDDEGSVLPPEERGDIADAYAPPRDPGGRNQILTGVLVVVAVAVVIFLVLLVVQG